MSDLALDFVIGLATTAGILALIALVLLVWGPDPRGRGPQQH